MAVATMTSKGQITIPKAIRDGLGLAPGDRVLFAPLPGGRVALVPRNRSVKELAGVLHASGRSTVSVEEMNAAISDEGSASGLRGLAAWTGSA
ncbi:MULTISPECIES: AbrB/MazE/SpoVT family DNA-binding domain-containing protein [Microbacterium]|uniref:AbrB/MazE/SpoVT family DNA-binding domain-containing protein n=1 Tax=Microbacterium TaxID=33882 RepID=UPI000836D04F|nr:AbrB/MazE/SpoVT family DNA-binding domain-containing protein [Microbacterium resistens]MBW1640118.1 AbrB/MazE/SpoVT family DNA-binding domain-containing protein [Microbacterium resistens]MDA4893295.1 AbrB/MazE/SpoVT family DNA-binding domain-containing protein [Streptomyces sp. MS2A]